MIHFKKTLMVAVLVSTPTIAQDVDLDVMNKIRIEGFTNSQVMDTLSYLTDEIGPRLTGSPNMRAANDWTAEQFSKWGLTNVKLQPFEFGPGWTMNHAYVHMTDPKNLQLYAAPISWHPGTNGPISAEVIYAPMRSKADFEQYKGKLKGKIVLVDGVGAEREPNNEVFKRLGDEDFTDLNTYNIPDHNGADSQMGWVNYRTFFFEREKFLTSEGAIAMVRKSPRSAMLLDAGSYQHMTDHLPQIPGVVVADEHYDRMIRLINKDKAVKMSLDVSVNFHREDTKSYNTLAEIKGKGRNPEIVMAGAHMDSWFLGTGAVDNGAGTAVVMEAMRILKAIGVEPKRTIRAALWSGEEQGYFGSQQYVTDNLADRPNNNDPSLEYMGPYEKTYNQFPITKKEEFDRFSAYFNLDNGGGKIRGIFSENNVAAAKLFEEWLKPFHNLDAKTVSLQETGGTDHEVFDDIGLPGFQFIQDPLDYGPRLHHTQLDVLDNAYELDLKQASVIMAAFLYNAAMSDTKMPRKPMPTK